MMVILINAVLLASLSLLITSAVGEEVVVEPEEYPHALRNPLKGFRAGFSDRHEYSTLTKHYIRWNEIENDESDGIENIRDYCNKRWRDKSRPVEVMNIKIIPRVYLHWSEKDQKYWPDDMQADDYESDQFRRRVLRLIERLGILWDNDPRIAYIEMGLIGKWGEHHSPDISPEMQKILGDAFTRAFQNKLVMVRHPWDFTDYSFGIYWDSWAHIQQVNNHGAGIAKLGERWKTAPMGGEAAYNWGKYKEQPGESPTDTTKDPIHREFFIDTVRWLHCNHVGWVANYDHSDAEARAGAEEIQKALGYRFVLTSVHYPSEITPGENFRVAFVVRNTGSSPFYYNWPVEVSLLKPDSHEVAWRGTFADLDIRTWLPGDRWNKDKKAYEAPPGSYRVEDMFQLPASIPKGEYILALAILDTAGMLPSMRFAIRNYYSGGRHPIGRIGVGLSVSETELDHREFDDPASDRSLRYTLKE